MLVQKELSFSFHLIIPKNVYNDVLLNLSFLKFYQFLIVSFSFLPASLLTQQNIPKNPVLSSTDILLLPVACIPDFAETLPCKHLFFLHPDKYRPNILKCFLLRF